MEACRFSEPAAHAHSTRGLTDKDTGRGGTHLFQPLRLKVAFVSRTALERTTSALLQAAVRHYERLGLDLGRVLRDKNQGASEVSSKPGPHPEESRMLERKDGPQHVKDRAGAASSTSPSRQVETVKASQRGRATVHVRDTLISPMRQRSTPS